GADGGIYSSWREPNTGAWQNWYRIGSASDTVPPQSVISVVSDKPERGDVLVMDAGGVIYSSWRDGKWGTWQNCYRIGSAGDAVPQQSVISVVSDNPERVHIFVVAAGGIYSSWRDGNSGTWQNWYRIGSASDTVPRQSVISVVSDKP